MNLPKNFQQKIALIIPWFLLSGVILISQRQNDTQKLPVLKTIDYALFRSGDLVFRQGNGVLSQTVLSRDRASEFSHVGVVKMIDNQPYVIHASTGKPLGTNAMVKMETIESFLQDASSLAALYRLNHRVSLGKNASDLAYQYSIERVPFDAQFSLQSQDKLYCTELVWQVYLQSGIDLVDRTFSELPFPFNQEPYILPSDLLASKHIDRVHRFEW